MRLLLVANLVIFYQLNATFTFAYKYAHEDAIFIEAGEDDEWARLARAAEIDVPTTGIPSTDIKGGQCVTSGGRPGECSLFRECYPNLVPIDDPGNKDTPGNTGTYNQGLAEILLNVSGICDGDSIRSYDETKDLEAAIRSEVRICCPDGSNSPPPLPSRPSESVISENLERAGCGVLKVELNTTRVVGGREAQKGEFPWIVALMNSGREFCGGSIINSQFVLTAAHCVQHMTQGDVSRMTVQLGDHNIYSTADGTHETRKASKVLYNKGFSMKHLYHDVALIKLSTPITFGTYIQPVCLHTGNPPYDSGSSQSDVAGWGQLSDGGSQPSTLRTVNIRVWKHSECKSKYGSQAPAGIGDGMVCAGGAGRGDSCRGDSGGPLTVDTGSTAKQIGIVSWGIGCGTYPGVYTRVDKYLSWINKHSQG